MWVAEVMLVQTRVDTVIPYYEQFLERFPDVRSLAEADLDDVFKAWEGLGYYARARNLHRAAGLIAREHDGRLPGTAEALRRLPGIGPYTAAAIASIAFGQPAPAVDGNVRRVISRLYDRAEATPAELAGLARPWVEGGRPGDVNQALMDLGATICVPRAPLCPECPLEGGCLARERGTAAERPGRRKSRPRPHYEIAVGVIWRDGRILIAKRPAEGLLGGLWEFPGGKREPGEDPEATVVREVREELGLLVEPGSKIAAVDHAYTHFEITLHAFHCRPRAGTAEPRASEDLAWVRPDELDDYAFPAANRRIIETLGKGPEDDAPSAPVRRASGRRAEPR